MGREETEGRGKAQVRSHNNVSDRQHFQLRASTGAAVTSNSLGPGQETERQGGGGAGIQPAWIQPPNGGKQAGGTEAQRSKTRPAELGADPTGARFIGEQVRGRPNRKQGAPRE